MDEPLRRSERATRISCSVSPPIPEGPGALANAEESELTMAKTKVTRTERYEVCQLCGGRGTETCYGQAGMTTTVMSTYPCRGCGGGGQKLVETTTTTESIEG